MEPTSSQQPPADAGKPRAPRKRRTQALELDFMNEGTAEEAVESAPEAVARREEVQRSSEDVTQELFSVEDRQASISAIKKPVSAVPVQTEPVSALSAKPLPATHETPRVQSGVPGTAVSQAPAASQVAAGSVSSAAPGAGSAPRVEPVVKAATAAAVSVPPAAGIVPKAGIAGAPVAGLSPDKGGAERDVRAGGVTAAREPAVTASTEKSASVAAPVLSEGETVSADRAKPPKQMISASQAVRTPAVSAVLPVSASAVPEGVGSSGAMKAAPVPFTTPVEPEQISQRAMNQPTSSTSRPAGTSTGAAGSTPAPASSGSGASASGNTGRAPGSTDPRASTLESLRAGEVKAGAGGTGKGLPAAASTASASAGGAGGTTVTQRIPAASASSAGATAASTASAAPRREASPGPVVDYRQNVMRQQKEQQSVGGILKLVLIVLTLVVLTGTGMAGYGAYVFWNELQAQRVTTAGMRDELLMKIDWIVKDLKDARIEINAVNQSLELEKEASAAQTEDTRLQLAALQKSLLAERNARAAELKKRDDALKQLRSQVERSGSTGRTPQASGQVRPQSPAAGGR